MKVAIVHDWLFGMRGGERCLEVIASLFPEADIFALFYEPAEISNSINRHSVTSSVLQRLPGVRKYYRHLLPWYRVGVNDLSNHLERGAYELVISVSHCVAKNVRVPRGAKHICYCLTPIRYLYDQYESYFSGRWYEPLVRAKLRSLRAWDVESAAGVDQFMAISKFVQARIMRCYGRDSVVVYPPVRSEWIVPRTENEIGEGFLCANALVPYKNVDVIVQAFNRLGYPLKIVGRGPELVRLQRMAKENIEFIPYVPDDQLAVLYRNAKALVFAAEEDFGMIPVEVQAAGRPVICWNRGGVLETVRADAVNPTGLMFSELSPAGICEAVEKFMIRQKEFSVDNCTRQAKEFSLERFKSDFLRVISNSVGFNPTPHVADFRAAQEDTGESVSKPTRRYSNSVLE